MRLSAAIAMLLIGGQTLPAAGGDVRIWPTAVAQDGDVRLGDVASVSGFDAGVGERLARIALRPAPESGRSEAVSVEDIRAALDGARVNLADVRILGAARCEVSGNGAARERNLAKPPVARTARQGSRLARSATSQTPVRTASLEPAAPFASDAGDDGTLESLLRREIDARVAELGGRAEVRFGAAQRAALALRSPDCQFKVTPRGDNRLGMVWFDAEIMRAWKPVQVVPVLAEVTLMRPVVVAAGIVNQGQEISTRDVRVESRAFKRTEDIGLTDSSLAIGMEARRALHPGDMLAAKDIRNKPLVRRNQIVTVWSRAGGLVVQSTGRALREASLGEQIEVRAEGAQDKYHATVTGPGTVAVGQEMPRAIAAAPTMEGQP